VSLQQPVPLRLLKQMKKEQEEMSDPMSLETPAGAARPSSPLRRWMPLVILLAALVAAYAAGLHNYLTLNAIADNRDSLIGFVKNNFAVAIVLFLLTYAAAVALSLPGASLLTILGGFLFGWLLGGVVTVVAATLGAVVIFLAARTSLGDTLAARAGPWMSRFREGFQRDAFNYMLFLRLVPVFPFWLVNIAPAVAGVPLGTYALTTLIGIIPGTFAFAVLGSGLDSIIEAQKAMHEACIAEKGAQNCTFSLDAGALITPELLAAFAALGFVALIPVIIKKMRAAR
jgi:uncharacterized membrane protein YdjX (TVP38/TMEM64 family)